MLGILFFIFASCERLSLVHLNNMQSLSNLDKWKEIGASKTVIDWIENGVLLPFSQLPEPTDLPNKKLSANQAAFLDSELRNLVKTGVIKKCYEKPTCVSPLNALPKKRQKSMAFDN